MSQHETTQIGDGGFPCPQCGEFHEDVPFAYGPPAPELYYRIPEAERESRCELTSDVCIIDGEYFFVVGNLEIPVLDTNHTFSWDVWVSLSRSNFERTLELWETVGRESEPPYFGWLSTLLPNYPETLNLKTHVHTRAVGRKPYIELQPTEHPLAIEQRDGITMDRVRQIAESLGYRPK